MPTIVKDVSTCMTKWNFFINAMEVSKVFSGHPLSLVVVYYVENGIYL